MKLVLLIIILVTSTTRLNADGLPLHISLVSYMSLNGADLATTEYCLGRGNCKETNKLFVPFSNSPVAFGIFKMASASITSWALLKTHKKHPKLALTLSLIGSTWYSAVVIHNHKELNK